MSRGRVTSPTLSWHVKRNLDASILWFMDSEVAALRTELKAWERSFRATHGRDPSIQDIKEEPNLGIPFSICFDPF